MKMSVWVLAGLLALSATGAQVARMTDPELASKLNISVQQLHSLRSLGFSNDQIAQMPGIQLQTLLWEVSHPGLDKHADELNFRMLRMFDEHGRIPPDGLQHALEQRAHVGTDSDLFPPSSDPSTNVPTFGTPGPMIAGIQTNGWTWLGPGNIGGRVRAILIHPTLTNILYCGGVDGGVWKSTNNGASWYPLNDFMANLAVACLAMDPTNANIIYAGTGEPAHNFDSIRGAGIFKTTDGGTTWAQLPATANSSFLYVGRLAIDPNNSATILAATRSGVWRSTDAGNTWTQRGSTEVLQVVFDPADSTQALAAGYNGHVLYSMDGGITWTAATGLPAPTGFGGRVEVAYAPSSPSTVYASVDNSSGQIYLSGDGGHSFTLLQTGSSYLGGQGWYDNVIWVDPTNPNVLVVGGGPDLWRSLDGGATLNQISQWYSAPASAHADHHAIVANPQFNGTTIRDVLFGNDGGVYRANDVYNVSLTSGWQSLNNNLGLTQFYGGAGNSNTLVVVGGTQDNGSLRYTPAGGAQGWTAMFGGDGGFSAADPTDPNYFYGEYVYLQVHRSSNGGASSSYIYSGITDAGSGSTANFIAPFILDPNNPNTMLAGGASLWRSSNVKAATPNWAAIKPSIGSQISAIAVAPGNSDIIWVGHNNGSVYSTANGTAASPTWTLRSTGLPARYCERIAILPGNPNQVYVTFGGYTAGNVWMTFNGGSNWSNITGNLPAAPVNSLVIAPNTTNTLYVGTEVGVFATVNNGVTWSTGNDGPANVSVDELFWLGNKLVAATHGRGMFYITPALGGPNLAIVSSAVSGGNGNGVVDPNECNQLNLVLQNVGGTNATNITAVLSTTTPEVTVLQAVSTYPNLASVAMGTNAIPFQLSTSPAFSCGSPVALTLTLTYSGVTNVLNYSLSGGSGGYTVSTSTGAAIVPGTLDIGNHYDDGTTTINLPFAFSFYGQSFTNATLSSNGNLQFNSSDYQWANSCLPYSGFNYAIVPLWDDLLTSSAGGGIFTSVTGTAPNRIFNIEWRATYYSSGLPLNFEVRLYEGQTRLDIVYGVLNETGSSATAGIQSDSGSTYLNYECNGGGLSPGLQLTFQKACQDGGGGCAPSVLANFAGAPTSGAAPLTVYFTNLSVAATNLTWTFGDGNTSSLVNPVNVYTNPGTYSVSLAAVGAGVTNTLTQSGYITVTNLPPVLITNVHQSGTNLVFSFPTVGGKTYTVQYKNSLSDPSWLPLGSVPGDGSIRSFSNSLVAPSQRFFRLSVQ